ncbi:MAG TPA: hypothetical protein PLQ35_02330 [bacterium]|nr:hypothetical protein [bacterium]HQL61110.1 hypothetical protein [bacterium]
MSHALRSITTISAPTPACGACRQAGPRDLHLPARADAVSFRYLGTCWCSGQEPSAVSTSRKATKLGITAGHTRGRRINALPAGELALIPNGWSLCKCSYLIRADLALQNQ